MHKITTKNNLNVCYKCNLVISDKTFEHQRIEGDTPHRTKPAQQNE